MNILVRSDSNLFSLVFCLW